MSGIDKKAEAVFNRMVAEGLRTGMIKLTPVPELYRPNVELQAYLVQIEGSIADHLDPSTPIYRAGFAARRAGQPASSNPHDELSAQWFDWAQGWKDQDDHQRDMSETLAVFGL